MNSHIQALHPRAEISKAAIQLLWRCFHFYAHFPFPRPTTDSRIDFEGYQRAILLLSIKGTDNLRLQDFDYYWDHDNAFFRKVGVQRIFRSFGVPPVAGKEHDSHEAIKSAANDIIDVLSITQPQNGFTLPVHTQLDHIAHRLLGDGAAHTVSVTSRDDFAVLISLLLRLRLIKEEWGAPKVQFGILDPESSHVRHLSEVLVDGLFDNQDTLARDQADKVSVILVRSADSHI